MSIDWDDIGDWLYYSLLIILLVVAYYGEYCKTELTDQKDKLLNQKIENIQIKVQQLEESTNCDKNSTIPVLQQW
jgi:ATP sulfurylase